MRFVQQGSGLYVPAPPVQGNLLFDTGESNTWGENPGLQLVTSALGYWDSDVSTPTSLRSTAWHNLHGTSFHLSHGPDASMGAALLAAPGNPYSGITAILTVALGGSLVTQWQIGDAGYAKVKGAIQQALSQLATFFPQVTSWQCRQVRNDGTSDMRVNNLAYQQQWAAYDAAWFSALQNDIVTPALGATPFSWKPTLYVQSCTFLSGAFFVSTGVIPQQYLAAVDAAHIINADSLSYEPDFVHMTTTGYIDLGTLIGNQIIYLDTHGG